MADIRYHSGTYATYPKQHQNEKALKTVKASQA